ncbi:hypothetical protein Y032_0647g1101 [Ancylostoma ceylanicum]|uniref:Uncharacterized protein n=1 Tax=Ancylostoma ceylanicum TaxID=53326 RepID=A0A016WIL8_9BILA|nr:hypothetical protein Y032_0647g1101 [Ancylostoma ceylanicum]
MKYAQAATGQRFGRHAIPREIWFVAVSRIAFETRRGTVDAIYAARLLIEKHREKQKPLHIALEKFLIEHPCIAPYEFMCSKFLEGSSREVLTTQINLLNETIHSDLERMLNSEKQSNKSKMFNVVRSVYRNCLEAKQGTPYSDILESQGKERLPYRNESHAMQIFAMIKVR